MLKKIKKILHKNGMSYEYCIKSNGGKDNSIKLEFLASYKQCMYYVNKKKDIGVVSKDYKHPYKKKERMYDLEELEYCRITDYNDLLKLVE